MYMDRQIRVEMTHSGLCGWDGKTSLPSLHPHLHPTPVASSSAADIFFFAGCPLIPCSSSPWWWSGPFVPQGGHGRAARRAGTVWSPLPLQAGPSFASWRSCTSGRPPSQVSRASPPRCCSSPAERGGEMSSKFLYIF
jgi:hypothetical protein